MKSFSCVRVERVRNCEVIQPKKVYGDVPVRVEYIQKDFAIGSIEGVSCVFIPTKIVSRMGTTRTQ